MGIDMMSSSEKPIMLHATHGERTFRIEEHPNVGFYIYAFEGERCTHDYLQDTLAIAKQCAREEFGIPEDAWHETTPTV